MDDIRGDKGAETGEACMAESHRGESKSNCGRLSSVLRLETEPESSGSNGLQVETQASALSQEGV